MKHNKSTEEFIKGLDKLSWELRKDVLDRRINVKKSIIRKIGVTDSITTVRTREELEGLSL